MNICKLIYTWQLAQFQSLEQQFHCQRFKCIAALFYLYRSKLNAWDFWKQITSLTFLIFESKSVWNILPKRLAARKLWIRGKFCNSGWLFWTRQLWLKAGALIGLRPFRVFNFCSDLFSESGDMKDNSSIPISTSKVMYLVREDLLQNPSHCMMHSLVGFTEVSFDHCIVYVPDLFSSLSKATITFFMETSLETHIPVPVLSSFLCSLSHIVWFSWLQPGTTIFLLNNMERGKRRLITDYVKFQTLPNCPACSSTSYVSCFVSKQIFQ